jgi:PAS domain-containing protein
MRSIMNGTESNPVDAVARYRFGALSHASKLLGDDTSPPRDGDEALRGMSGLVASSLEELRVAEEELRAANLELEAQRAGIEARVLHYQQLFLQAPTAILVTDVFATVAEANLAAAAMLRRPPDYLERKPLAALVTPAERAEFRRKLDRCLEAGDMRDFDFSVLRVGDVPLEVSATVKRVDGIGPTASGLLYWHLCPRTAP